MSENKQQIRKPVAAGLFYPGSAGELTKTVASLFNDAEKIPVNGHPVGLIVPHAGYPYSGQTAVRAYKLLEGEQYDTVIVVSPSHTVFFKGASIYEGDAYETPLGKIEIDKELSEKIATINPAVHFSNNGHATGSTRGEHALEVQLPFLQIVLGKFKLVAIVMGDQEEDTVHALSETLALALKNRNTLLVASSDLSHFKPEKRARKLDFNIQKAVEQYNPDMLMETLETGQGEACGGGVIAAVMMATKKLGDSSVKFIDYNTSGSTTGDFEEVVGYLSAVILSSQKVKQKKDTIGVMPAEKNMEFTLTDEDKDFLKQIAHDAIRAKLDDKIFEVPKSLNEELEIQKGLFVTLTINGRLRGCIGRIKGDLPLTEGVAEMAVAAAFEDPRFRELNEYDFEKLDYEISVLSSLERVDDFNTIEVGVHGLLIKMDINSGLLLPQVASDNEWTATQFLEQTCLKAGLPKNSYQNKFCEIYKFSALVF